MLILSTDSLRGYDLNRIFEITKKAGYQGIDLAIDNSRFDTYDTQYIKKLIEEFDLPVHSVCTPKQISVKKLTEIVELTKDINAKVLVLQPPKRFGSSKLTKWMKKEVPKLREKNSISIAIENAPAGMFLGFIPEYSLSNTAELKGFKHVSLDTARIGENKKDLMRAYNSLKKYIVQVHFSNLYHNKKYAPPQEGIMPLESFLTKLKQDKYPGAISLKVLPKFLKAGKEDKVISNLKEIKKYYDKYYTEVTVPE